MQFLCFKLLQTDGIRMLISELSSNHLMNTMLYISANKINTNMKKCQKLKISMAGTGRAASHL
jgi:hypothetical protein